MTVVVVVAVIVLLSVLIVSAVATYTRGEQDRAAANTEIAANPRRPPGLALIGSEVCECGAPRGVWRGTTGTGRYVANCPTNPRHSLAGETP